MASVVGGLSVVWAAIGIYIVVLALRPGGEPDDAAVLFVPILSLSLVGLGLSARAAVWQRGALALGIFAVHLAVAAGLNSVIVPFVDYGPWSTSDTVSWVLGLANVAILAAAGWTLCRRSA